MAKVRGFLSGATGKVGDFVLQKGEKATVLRANNGTANPQSAAQMAQRLAFATTNNAAKKLLSVIGLSFAGVTNGKYSRRKFVELNTPILKSYADKYINGEIEYSEDACYYKAKNISQLVPNPYIVSDGSLVLAEQMNIKVSGGFLSLFVGDYEFGLHAVSESSVTVPGSQVIESLFGCSSGDQLTLVGIYGKQGDSVAYEYENGENVTVNGVYIPNYDWMRFTRLYAPRIVFKSSGLPDLTIVSDETSTSLTAKLKAVILGCVDTDKSSSDFVNLIADNIYGHVSDTLYGAAIDEQHVDTKIGLEGWKMLCAGIIRSANVDGSWDFSHCQLVVNMDTDTAGGPSANDEYSGLQLGTAIYSYVGVEDANGSNFMTTGTPYDSMPVS